MKKSNKLFYKILIGTNILLGLGALITKQYLSGTSMIVVGILLLSILIEEKFN